MSGSRSIWTVLVGVFVGFGFFLTIATAVWLGLNGMKDTYRIEVHVDDAGGIEKGATVEFGGIRIGKVAEKPYFKPDYTALLIKLDVESNYKIPRSSLALIDTLDQYGGTYVKITMPKEKPENFVVAGDIINGKRIDREAMKAQGMEGSMSKLQDSMKSLDESSANMEKLISLLGGGSSEEGGDETPTEPGTAPSGLPAAMVAAGGGANSMSSMNDAMKSFEATNKKMSITLDKFDRLLADAGGSLVKMEGSMANFDTSMLEVSEMAMSGDRTFAKIHDMADDNTQTTEDLHLAINEFRGMIRNTNPIITTVREGDGLLQTLATDEEMDQDIRSFADKLEKHGILFYPREKKCETRMLRSRDPIARRR